MELMRVSLEVRPLSYLHRLILKTNKQCTSIKLQKKLSKHVSATCSLWIVSSTFPLPPPPSGDLQLTRTKLMEPGGRSVRVRSTG